VLGGSVTVAFILAVNRLFGLIWHRRASLGTLNFAIGSFVVIAVSSVASGILMAKILPDAAGSGIPQLKAAYWMDLGVVPLRAVNVLVRGGEPEMDKPVVCLADQALRYVEPRILESTAGLFLVA